MRPFGYVEIDWSLIGLGGALALGFNDEWGFVFHIGPVGFGGGFKRVHGWPPDINEVAK